MIIFIVPYVAIVYLVFSKICLLPWNKVSQAISSETCVHNNKGR